MLNNKKTLNGGYTGSKNNRYVEHGNYVFDKKRNRQYHLEVEYDYDYDEYDYNNKFNAFDAELEELLKQF